MVEITKSQLETRVDNSEAAENGNSCLFSSVFFMKCEAVGGTRCDDEIALLTAAAKNGGIYTETHFTAVAELAICSVTISTL